MACDSDPAIALSGAGGLPAQWKGQPIVVTLDVAGQDEATFHNPDEQMLRNPGRDAVSLTIASVDLSAMQTLQAPIFRILHREQWTGLNHLSVFGRLTALADRWRPQHIVIDATGVGEGLWAMLDRHYPTRVIPVKFCAQKKSEIGYRFLAMIETGRLRDCALADAAASANVGARQGGSFLPYHIVAGASSDLVALRKGRSSPAWRAQPDEAIPSATVTPM